MNKLVGILSPKSEVVFVRPERSAIALKESISREYVLVLFEKTNTEIGMHLIMDECMLEADFVQGKGIIQLVGILRLNFEPLKAVVQLDLSTCSGHGRLFEIHREEYNEIWNGIREKIYNS